MKFPGFLNRSVVGLGLVAGLLMAGTTVPANAAAGFAVTPTSKDFGSQPIGTNSAPQTFTVTNTGTTPLIIGPVTLAGTDQDQFAKGPDTCSGANLAINTTCTVSVRFFPTSPGAKTARLRFVDNAAGSPHSAALSGFGTAPVFAVSPTSKDFGTQPIGTTSASQTFTVTNTGDAPLLIFAAQLDGADPGQFTEVSDDCSVVVVVAPAQTCTVTVSFAPTSRGAKTAVLRFTDNAAGSPHDVGLSGFGTAPEFAVSPTSADFGNRAVGSSSARRTFTVTNTGDAPLVITDALLAGADAGDFTEVTDDCSGQTLAAAATCTVTVAFSPQSYKPKTAVLRFTHNAAGSPTDVTLTGIGTSPPGADPDNDGVLTRDDNCPNDANPGQADSDGDGFGDPCDNQQRDVDFDNIPGPTDNCPAVSNPGQADSDGDGVGDACDTSDQPGTDKQRINPAIKGKNIRRTGKDWVLVRARAAGGAHVRIFTITDRHRRVLVDEGRLNARGVYKTVIDDPNGRDVTAYKAVVSATSDTRRGVTNRLQQQRSATR
jgi:hypothetical protein